MSDLPELVRWLRQLPDYQPEPADALPELAQLTPLFDHESERTGRHSWGLRGCTESWVVAMGLRPGWYSVHVRDHHRGWCRGLRQALSWCASGRVPECWVDAQQHPFGKGQPMHKPLEAIDWADARVAP